jgi:two-component system sensor histidine kinase KdpD
MGGILQLMTLNLRSLRDALFPLTGRPVLAIAEGLTLVAVLVPILEALHGPSGRLGQSIPLLFLIPVLIASAVGGPGPGVVVSFAAVFVWDWFFIPPFYTVTVASVRDVVALIVFLADALLTGQLAVAARERAGEALRRARSAEAMYDLSTALIGSHDLSTVLPALTARLRETFDLEACAVLLPNSGGKWRTVATSGEVPIELNVERSRDAAALASWARREQRPCGFGEMASTVPEGHAPYQAVSRLRAQFLPLLAEDRSIGVLEIVQKKGHYLDADQQRLLITLSNGIAIAVEHERLAKEEREAAVARESDRLKSALLSSVSHDLRTPLAGIKAAASSLLQDDVQWSEEDRRAFAADIDAEADRLSRLVSNLLDLSRIEAGVIKPNKEWEDVAELIRRVVRRLKPGLGDHPITVEVASGLPHARFDTIHVEQALTNLIENAAKYSSQGSPIEVTARVENRPDRKQELHIAVVDRGPGISPADQTRIFDKFYRIAEAGRRTGGTGMGLAIVKGLVEANGGRVVVESEPGAGSTFTIVLPLERERDSRADDLNGHEAMSPSSSVERPAT